MTILFLLIYVFIGWKFGVWKEFKRLYPTLLFFIIGDLLYQFLLFDYTMWMFHPVGTVDEGLGLNHTLIAIGRMSIQYPVTIAVFLGRMTSEKKQQILSIILWIVIYNMSEFFFNYAGGLTYHNGWNYGWDIAFTLMMFPMLLIHYKNPIVAWLLVIPIVFGLWWIFDVPFSVLK
ncbi:CBO0543 family protein [Virgibacillus byunsanensis]|uniref:CBO0543 family protein n=1 Tax=Virgibacillus byunsanensis TaxID=570945 RepID=A0ABW3LLF9_9BACI